MVIDIKNDVRNQILSDISAIEPKPVHRNPSGPTINPVMVKVMPHTIIDPQSFPLNQRL